MSYSPERREAVLKKMLPPDQRSIPDLAKEEGIAGAHRFEIGIGPARSSLIPKNRQ
jgi:hypothetical protein